MLWFHARILADLYGNRHDYLETHNDVGQVNYPYFISAKLLFTHINVAIHYNDEYVIYERVRDYSNI